MLNGRIDSIRATSLNDNRVALAIEPRKPAGARSAMGPPPKGEREHCRSRAECRQTAKESIWSAAVGPARQYGVTPHAAQNPMRKLLAPIRLVPRGHWDMRSVSEGAAASSSERPASLPFMPAHHTQARPLVVANARQSPGYGCALRLDRPRVGALLGQARKTLRLWGRWKGAGPPHRARTGRWTSCLFSPVPPPLFRCPRLPLQVRPAR